MKKIILCLTLLFTFTIKENTSLTTRGPASFEVRPSEEEIKKREEDYKIKKEVSEKFNKIRDLKAELDGLETENRYLLEGLQQIGMYHASPASSIGVDPKALENFILLKEQNSPYIANKIPTISYGEMNSPFESFYYGLPFSPRLEKYSLESPQQIPSFYQQEFQSASSINLY